MVTSVTKDNCSAFKEAGEKISGHLNIRGMWSILWVVGNAVEGLVSERGLLNLFGHFWLKNVVVQRYGKAKLKTSTALFPFFFFFFWLTPGIAFLVWWVLFPEQQSFPYWSLALVCLALSKAGPHRSLSMDRAMCIKLRTYLPEVRKGFRLLLQNYRII